MTSREYDPIDETVAQEIKRLHKEYPKLGHDGLLDALRQADIEVDPQEIETFMREHHIKAERPWRPWRWTGIRGSWLGGSVVHPRTRRWRLWRR